MGALRPAQTSVQALYLKGPYEMVFEWGKTYTTFDYDFFNVRLGDGRCSNMEQSEVRGYYADSRGRWIMLLHSAGLSST